MLLRSSSRKGKQKRGRGYREGVIVEGGVAAVLQEAQTALVKAKF